jgi:hypothetical protein
LPEHTQRALEPQKFGPICKQLLANFYTYNPTGRISCTVISLFVRSEAVHCTERRRPYESCLKKRDTGKRKLSDVTLSCTQLPLLQGKEGGVKSRARGRVGRCRSTLLGRCWVYRNTLRGLRRACRARRESKHWRGAAPASTVGQSSPAPRAPTVMALKFDVGFSEDENLKWRKSMEVSGCVSRLCTVSSTPHITAATLACSMRFTQHARREPVLHTR